ncbi:hypothetical protein ACQ4M3_37330 [Leptolyngbya sp. AN03gr2]|uniref:hypothetical protein n=1 Tax=unclassified Leptolyngbya TaxID=2650499 RepID=UPI003D3144AF
MNPNLGNPAIVKRLMATDNLVLPTLDKNSQDYIREGIAIASHYLEQGNYDNVHDILKELCESFCEGIDPLDPQVFYDAHRHES